MTYAKPEIAVDNAVRAIRGALKHETPLTDFGGPVGTGPYNTQPAYEADE